MLGIGGVGSAALRELSRRNLNVLGIEQFTVAHDRGSSHGQTRLIRQAYFEHPNYVPLLTRAYELWDELEETTSQKLFYRCGLLEVGPPDGVLIPGVEESARQHDLHIERLTETEARKRFPQFRVPTGYQAVFEPSAGFLMVEKCVQANIKLARSLGAKVAFETKVQQVDFAESLSVLQTDRGVFAAPKLIICGGAWMPQLLPIAGNFRVVRKHLDWLRPRNNQMHVDQGCPGFLYEVDEGHFYGFPQIDELGVKVAEHSGGETQEDPASLSKAQDGTSLARTLELVDRCLPFVTHETTHHDVCMYTMSPDNHFVVDRHPDVPGVVFAAGLSGHGFKFTSVLGEILCQLAIDGETSHDTEFLAHSRFKHTST